MRNEDGSYYIPYSIDTLFSSEKNDFNRTYYYNIYYVCRV